MNEPNVNESTPAPSPSDPPVDPPTPTPTPELAPGEQKSLTDPPAPAPKPEPFVPLTADDIQLPEVEGLVVSDELRDEFLTVVNDQDLSPKDRAQALVNLQTKVATLASEAISKEWNDTNQAWQDEVKADTEIGGTKLPETLGRIGRLIDENAKDAGKLREAFSLTGAGNNPEVVRFLSSIANKLTEAGPVSGQPKSEEGSRAQRMFPSMKPQ